MGEVNGHAAASVAPSQGSASSTGSWTKHGKQLESAQHASTGSAAMGNGSASLAARLPNGKDLGFASDIDRPGSAASMRIRVDKQSSEPSNGTGPYSHLPYDASGLSDIWARPGPRPGPPTLYSRVRLEISQLIANCLSTAFLLFVVLWALSVHIFASLPVYLGLAPKRKELVREWDEPERWKDERLVKDVRYYAKSCGFEIINETVETEDGYLLRMHRVIDPTRQHERHSDGKGGFPVLIMHGLFQSSGSFVTSEERSLAFWLARQGGYQVFLGNNRAVFGMGHKTLKRSDPRFWDYNIRELAIYDLPALVDYVRKETGYDKIAFIGHSQGNGTMFISLSQGMVPELGEKLTYFGALAPAVFAGPLTSCFPFTTLGGMDWPTWKRFFGVRDFIPLMRVSYTYAPPFVLWRGALLLFAFLFNWHDTNWLQRRKGKTLLFAPSPMSSKLLHWWSGRDGFATRGCTMDPSIQWYDARFPPLSIYSGGLDFLVLTEPLIERIRYQETDVHLLRYERQEEAEHCDHFWAADAVSWCFESLKEDIEMTRTRYPEELEAGASSALTGKSQTHAQSAVDQLIDTSG